MNKESTPMQTLFDYIEDGSKLHSLVTMNALFLHYERVWLTKLLAMVSDTDRADIVAYDIYKDEKK